jgi:ABC-2 type transport system permease protein
MKLSKSWIIASKDLKILRKKKGLIYGVVVLPLFIAIGLPLVVRVAGRNSGGIPPDALPQLLDAFSFFFLIPAAILPTSIASYSLVGEKVEKSLEPLLATPITDGELLFGKSLAAFLPPIASIYGGATLFMVLMDNATRNSLGYLYFPNSTIGIILLLGVPLSAILSVLLNVIISARVNDIRSAQQLGSLVVLPFAGIYLSVEVNILHLDTNNLLLISTALLAADLILFYVSRLTFSREEILTKWK